MNTVLKEWLRDYFNDSNIPKYRKYFEEWVSNLTDVQISGFEEMRIGKITKNKYMNY